MSDVVSEVSKKVKSAIKAKLVELDAYVDDELPDYIMVLVANKRSKGEMDEDLSLFLGGNTECFTTWLNSVLKKLNDAAILPASEPTPVVTAADKPKQSEIIKPEVTRPDDKKSESKPPSSQVQIPPSAKETPNSYNRSEKKSKLSYESAFPSSKHERRSKKKKDKSEKKAKKDKKEKKKKKEKHREKERNKSRSDRKKEREARHKEKAKKSSNASKTEAVKMPHTSDIPLPPKPSQDANANSLPGSGDFKNIFITVKQDSGAKIVNTTKPPSEKSRTPSPESLKDKTYTPASPEKEDSDVSPEGSFSNPVELQSPLESEKIVIEDDEVEAPADQTVDIELSVSNQLLDIETGDVDISLSDEAKELKCDEKALLEIDKESTTKLSPKPCIDGNIKKPSDKISFKRSRYDSSSDEYQEAEAKKSRNVNRKKVDKSSNAEKKYEKRETRSTKRIKKYDENTEPSSKREKKRYRESPEHNEDDILTVTQVGIDSEDDHTDGDGHEKHHVKEPVLSDSSNESEKVREKPRPSVHDRLGPIVAPKDARRILNLREESSFSSKQKDTEKKTSNRTVDREREKPLAKRLEARVRPLISTRSKSPKSDDERSRGPRLGSKVVPVSKRSLSDDEDREKTKIASKVSRVEPIPRPKRPASQTANSALIMRAMADAHKSVNYKKKRIYDEDDDLERGPQRKRERSTVDLRDKLEGSRYSDDELKSDDRIRGSVRQIAITVPNRKKTEADKEVEEESESYSSTEEMEEIYEGEEEMVDRVEPPKKIYVKSEIVSARPLQGLGQSYVTRTEPEDNVDSLRYNLAGKPIRHAIPGEEDEYIDEVEEWTEEYDVKTADLNPYSVPPPPLPVTIPSTTTTAPSVVTKPVKSEERCRFWPLCNAGEDCPYVHPSVACTDFPACKAGTKCTKIHPTCKFNGMCIKPLCPFVHTVTRNNLNFGVSASVPRMSAPLSKTPCHFYPKCANPSCPYLHPKSQRPCNFGKNCLNANCTFSHIDLPVVRSSVGTRSKLKWIAPGTAVTKAPPVNTAFNNVYAKSNTIWVAPKVETLSKPAISTSISTVAVASTAISSSLLDTATTVVSTNPDITSVTISSVVSAPVTSNAVNTSSSVLEGANIDHKADDMSENVEATNVTKETMPSVQLSSTPNGTCTDSVVPMSLKDKISESSLQEPIAAGGEAIE